MEAPITLARPANWQDFESLCKKLWGEIWNCPEIQKNGRLGQEQFGVDVFGMPEKETEYFAIQCKGKSEYNDNQYEHPQFTEKEILKEIEKAKTFEPKLKKWYLATTALNDSKIQTFIRVKNIEHIKAGLFEVHLFSWESIVDLILENKETYNYYVKSLNYKTKQSVAVTFDNGETELIVKPKFKRNTIIYKKETSLYENPLQDLIKSNGMAGDFIVDYKPLYSKKTNKSYFDFQIIIKNTGDEPIENYKLELKFIGNILNLKDTNDSTDYLLINPKKVYDTFLWEESMTGKLVPARQILVSDDTFISDSIFIKADPTETDVLIEWNLLSKHFKSSGVLNIKIDAEIFKNRTLKTVDSINEERTEYGEIEDYLEVIK